MTMRAKAEHRPGAEIRRETVRLGYCKATLSDARMGEGYRLSLSRRRSVGHGTDIWLPVYNWRSLDYDLPRDGLSQWQVHKALEAMNAEATRLYQAEKQRRACQRRRDMLWHRDHTEPQHTVETEHLPDRTLCRIID
jgi:hypothetical protein